MNFGNFGAQIQAAIAANAAKQNAPTQSSAENSNAQCIAAQVFQVTKDSEARNAQTARYDACPDDKRNFNLQNAKTELAMWLSPEQAKYTQFSDKYDMSVNFLNQFMKIVNPTNEYLAKLDEETTEMGEKSLRYNQHERTKRRSFLDEDPQGGVTGIPGVRTYDDKVLLAFWITYGVCVLCLCLIYLKFQGGNVTFVSKLTTIVGGLAVAYGIAYGAIVTFA
jgi:hypothetical protein